MRDCPLVEEVERGDDTRPAAEPLARLKEWLAAVLLVAVAAVAAGSAVASCTIAVLGQVGVLEPWPLAWLGVAAAGAAGVRLLVFAHARISEPADRRVIPARLR